MGETLGNLEWCERDGLDREGRDLDRDAAWTVGLSIPSLSILALLTLLFVFGGGPLGAGVGLPMLILIVSVAAVSLVRDLIGSSGPRQALSLPAGEDTRPAPSLPAGKERELLTALRDNNGGMTPVEAAIETSLTVREADRTLSELAGAGHLALEIRNGALFYSIPGRGDPGLGD